MKTLFLLLAATLLLGACQHKSRLTGSQDEHAFCKANPDQCVMREQQVLP